MSRNVALNLAIKPEIFMKKVKS